MCNRLQKILSDYEKFFYPLFIILSGQSNKQTNKHGTRFAYKIIVLRTLTKKTSRGKKMKNQIETEKIETTTAADFVSITSGASAETYSAAYAKQIEKIYPGLIADIERSGIIAGSKFFRIYLSHNLEKNKSRTSRFLFLRDIPTPKKIAALPPAAKSGKNILTDIPKNFTSLSKLHNAVFIITITSRGRDYRTLHINLNH